MTLCHPILSVIIVVFNKLDSLIVVLQFCHSLMITQIELDSTQSYCHRKFTCVQFTSNSLILISFVSDYEWLFFLMSITTTEFYFFLFAKIYLDLQSKAASQIFRRCGHVSFVSSV